MAHPEHPPSETELLERITKTIENGERPKRYLLIIDLCQEHYAWIKQRAKPESVDNAEKREEKYSELARASSSRFRCLENLFKALASSPPRIELNITTGEISLVTEKENTAARAQTEESPA